MRKRYALRVTLDTGMSSLMRTVGARDDRPSRVGFKGSDIVYGEEHLFIGMADTLGMTDFTPDLEVDILPGGLHVRVDPGSRYKWKDSSWMSVPKGKTVYGSHDLTLRPDQGREIILRVRPVPKKSRPLFTDRSETSRGAWTADQFEALHGRVMYMTTPRVVSGKVSKGLTHMITETGASYHFQAGPEDAAQLYELNQRALNRLMGGYANGKGFLPRDIVANQSALTANATNLSYLMPS